MRMMPDELNLRAEDLPGRFVICDLAEAGEPPDSHFRRLSGRRLS